MSACSHAVSCAKIPFELLHSTIRDPKSFVFQLDPHRPHLMYLVAAVSVCTYNVAPPIHVQESMHTHH